MKDLQYLTVLAVSGSKVLAWRIVGLSLTCHVCPEANSAGTTTRNIEANILQMTFCSHMSSWLATLILLDEVVIRSGMLVSQPDAG